MVIPSRLGTRGGRVVTNAGRDAVDAKAPNRRAALFTDGEVAWSWRAHAGAKSSRRHPPFDDDGGNQLVHRGEREVSRKPLRREGRRDSACTCGQRAHAQNILCVWAVGAAGTRSSLRPRLFHEGIAPGITRAESAARTWATVPRLFEMLK